MGRLTSAQVTACLVTRGDCDMQPILDSLIFDRVMVWDNSERSDMKTFGRYAAAALASSDVVYFQDDDCLVPAETQEALLAAYEPGVFTVNYGHGEDPDGYEDIALFHGGGIVDRALIAPAFERYLELWPRDEWFLYEADFIFGCLTPHRTLHLPFGLREVCFSGDRMCDQPWQREKKLLVANRARAIRDRALVAA